MTRFALGLLLACASTAGIAAVDPRTVPTQLPPAWQAKTRAVFKQAIEIPSVHNRGEVPRVAKLLADQFRSAGIPIYGTNGAWVQVPTDFRAHGKDERIPVQSLYDNVVHWQIMLRDLAGK